MTGVADPRPVAGDVCPRVVQELCELLGKQTKPRGRTPAQAGPVNGGLALPVVTFPAENEQSGALRGSANLQVSPWCVPELLSADVGV